MTTNVTINAHCADNKEVKITITDDDSIVEETILQSGEIAYSVVYDDRVVSICEIDK